jgi:hypothetical protein
MSRTLGRHPDVGVDRIDRVGGVPEGDKVVEHGRGWPGSAGTSKAHSATAASRRSRLAVLFPPFPDPGGLTERGRATLAGTLRPA